MFLAQFLFVTLTEDTLSLGIGSLDIRVGVVLGNCHKANPLWQCIEYLVQMTFNVEHTYCSFLLYSKTSIVVVSLMEAMT